VTTLAERLASHGFDTAAITANAHYLAHGLGMDQGFVHYDDRWGANLSRILLPQFAGFVPWVGHSVYRDAETITDLAQDWIAARMGRRPFFLFLNYMDAHGPYAPRPQHHRRSVTRFRSTRTRHRSRCRHCSMIGRCCTSMST
jgi:hypothetical protein